MKKDAYSIDNFNRLLVSRGRKKLVADGRFSVDKENALSYWLNEPVHWRRENSLPPKIKFTGKWNLGRDYDLELVLDKTEGRYIDNRLSLKAEIISVHQDSGKVKVKAFVNDKVVAESDMVFVFIKFDDPFLEKKRRKLLDYWMEDLSSNGK
jgi:hypothetical protein